MRIYIFSPSLSSYVIRLYHKLASEMLSPEIFLMAKAQENPVRMAHKKYLHHGFYGLIKSGFEKILFQFFAHEINIKKNLSLSHILTKVNCNSLVLLYNTGLIPRSVVKKSRVPILVAHPSYLPYGRGLNGTRQAILQGVPPGVSVLEIDEGIDTGPVWFQEYVNLDRCRDLKDLRRRQADLGITLTVKACKAYQANTVKKLLHEKKPIKKMTQDEIRLADEKLILLLRT